jgi:hypothetical protein
LLGTKIYKKKSLGVGKGALKVSGVEFGHYRGARYGRLDL